MTTTTVWDLVREGWSVTWWATVDAIDTVFADAPIALALPTGFASHVDDLLLDVAGDLGCEVLDDAGVAAGLSLAFELRDSAEVRALVAWPTRMQRLSQTETASATTLNLVDTSGLSSPVYVGHERVTFAGSTATTLTTVGRATGGSLASKHRAEGVGGLVASSPLPDWRGRRVRLYAAAIDPAGVQLGASLALVSTEVWSGYVDEGPYRTERGTWRVDALPLVRRLAEALPPSTTGIVDASTRWHFVQAGDTVDVELRYGDGTGGILTESLHLHPYSAATLGASQATLAASSIRQTIEAAWATELAAMGGSPLLGVLKFVGEGDKWRALVSVGTAPAADQLVVWSIAVNGQKVVGSTFVSSSAIGIECPWVFPSSPLHLTSDGKSSSLVVALQTSSPADIVAPGAFRHGDVLYRFATIASLQGAVRLDGIAPPFDPATADGDEVEFVAVASGTLASTLLGIIESSGTASLRGAFDLLAADAGYSIDDSQVDEASFANVGGVLASLYVSAVVSGRSLDETFGTMLGLSERAIVQRVVDDVVQLALVTTSPLGSSSASTITDADLLVAAGDNPIEVSRGPRTPTIVEVTLDDGSPSPTRIIMQRDASRRAEVGAVTLQATMPIADASLALGLVATWAGARFARLQPADRLRLQVGPWVRGEVGDLVRLETRHPAVYDRRAASPGYAGSARVLGRTLDPATLVVTLTVAPAVGVGLSPAARVEAYAGTAAAPTTIDVDLAFLAHFERSLADYGGAIKLLHFQPAANEGVAEGYTVNAATSAGGYCRLTVASIIGGATLSTSGARSWLTMPVSGDPVIADYQLAFAHTNGGEFWA
jgi:hypothetical protein